MRMMFSYFAKYVTGSSSLPTAVLWRVKYLIPSFPLLASSHINPRALCVADCITAYPDASPRGRWHIPARLATGLLRHQGNEKFLMEASQACLWLTRFSFPCLWDHRSTREGATVPGSLSNHNQQSPMAEMGLEWERNFVVLIMLKHVGGVFVTATQPGLSLPSLSMDWLGPCEPTTPTPAWTGGKPHHVPRIFKQLLDLLFQKRGQSSIPSYLKSFHHNRGVK